MALTQRELEKMLPEKRKAYEKRRKKVMRNRAIFASFISFLLVVVTVLVLSLTVFFHIDTITVNGTSRYDNQQIIQASGIVKGNNLFLSSVVKAKENIQTQFPYLSKVSVERKLPATIVINITGAEAEYCYQTSGGYALADSTGRVMEIVNADAVPVETTVIKTNAAFVANVGEKVSVDENKSDELKQEDEKELELLGNILDAMKKSEIADITSVDVTTVSEIKLVYQDRLTLNLGSSLELEYKLKSAVEIIKKEDEISTTTSGEINLSNPGNVYVSPESEKVQ